MTRILIIAALLSISIFASAQKNAHFTVDSNGDGNFLTVQEAIDAVPDFRKSETIIFIKKGTYKEKLVLADSKTNVTFIGEDKMSTIITNDDYAQKLNTFGEEMGTTGSSSFFIFGDGFKAENITFENSAGPVGQAVAVRVTADKVIFNNCRFLGNQDTLYPNGTQSRQYYKNCYIEGTVDFIFGWATCVFDECVIFCKTSGYVTAASTGENSKYGFIFRNCHITGNAPEASFYLGRPWRPHAKVVYLNCQIDHIIKLEGWNNWGKESNEKTAYYAEYNCTGEAAPTKRRVSWSHQLSLEQAQTYTLENIFKKETNIPAYEADWLPSL
ncbi:MAG: pectinesterase family protein [Mangrovibacterium sp.]